MKTKGFEGPFQLLIAVIIMGMALTVGFYLMNMVNCWRCEEMARAEAIDFKEKIANVGDGDIGSVATVNLELLDCIEGFYIRSITPDIPSEKDKCKGLCPQHPDQCWVLFADSRCSGRFLLECIDIAGDMIIEADPLVSVEWDEPGCPGPGCGDEWKHTSFPFTSKTYLLKISKSAPNKILIGRP